MLPPVVLLPAVALALAASAHPLAAAPPSEPLAQAAFQLPPKPTLSPHDIQGPGWLSSYDGQRVHGLRGLVTAKSAYGFYIQSVESDDDDRTSDGLYVYGSQVVSAVEPGDIITLSGLVSEYTSDPTSFLHLTELSFVSNLTIHSTGNDVTPVVLGVDRVPPGERIYVKDQFELKAGVDVEKTGEALRPAERGLDFWESLEGMLVTIPAPRAVVQTTYRNDLWLVGPSYATHSNARGGLTLGLYEEGWDVNPEAILVWRALDGGKNPSVVMGTVFEDVTGVVSYNNGFPVLLPLTAPLVKSVPGGAYRPTALEGDGKCQLSVGNYNIENFGPRSRTVGAIAAHIVNYLKLPDVLGLEEIQDDSGVRDDGTTCADQTLKVLTDAVFKLSGVRYGALNIAPANNQDGGQRGGNIRPAVLFRLDRMELDSSSPPGKNDEAQFFILDEETGETTFALNPGLIDPKNEAWVESRKPLTASFIVKGSSSEKKRLHVVVAHFSSKRGSGPTEGRVQTALNGSVNKRIAQAKVVDDFVANMLTLDPDVKVVFLGDLNEFSNVQPLDVLSRHLIELLVPEPTERYSFQFDQSSQQIDHIFVVPSLLPESETEIVHLNTWKTKKDQASDHDPVLARIKVC